MAEDTDDARRQRNVDAVHRLIAAINGFDGASQADLLAEGVSYEGPYYNLHVQGRDRLVGMFTGLATRFDTLDYQITQVFPALDPDLVIYEVRGDHPVKDSTKRYQNQYIFFTWFEDGRITRWVEYSNPKVYEEATS